MPDLAKQFTREEIEQALDYIIENNIELRHSTKHDLMYKNRSFAPKEVVRWLQNLKMIKIDNTNKPLRELGVSFPVFQTN